MKKMILRLVLPLIGILSFAPICRLYGDLLKMIEQDPLLDEFKYLVTNC